MKKILVFVLSIYLFAFSSCKKSTTAPSIVGTWNLADVTGMVVYTGNPGTHDTVTYSFGSANNIYTWTEDYSDPFIRDTSTYQVNTENWSFNADGSYSINESYNQNGAAAATTNTVTGTWEYLSNTHANDGLILTGATSVLFPSFSKDNNTYNIQTLNSSTLILTVINNQTSSTGTIDYNNVVITFSRQ